MEQLQVWIPLLGLFNRISNKIFCLSKSVVCFTRHRQGTPRAHNTTVYLCRILHLLLSKLSLLQVRVLDL